MTKSSSLFLHLCFNIIFFWTKDFSGDSMTILHEFSRIGKHLAIYWLCPSFFIYYLLPMDQISYIDVFFFKSLISRQNPLATLYLFFKIIHSSWTKNYSGFLMLKSCMNPVVLENFDSGHPFFLILFFSFVKLANWK